MLTRRDFEAGCGKLGLYSDSLLSLKEHADEEDIRLLAAAIGALVHLNQRLEARKRDGEAR